MTIEIEPGRYFSHFWFVSCPTKDRRALRGRTAGRSSELFGRGAELFHL